MRSPPVFLAVCLFVTAISGPARSQPSGTLRYIENEMPISFDPVTSGGKTIGVRLSDLIFAGLYTYDLQSNPTPDMARALPELTDRSKRLVTVPLKQGLRWHDGRPIRPKDIDYTIKIYKNPRSNYPNIGMFQNILSASPAGTDVQIELQSVPGVETNLGIRLGAQLRFPLLPRHAIGQDALTLANPFCTYPIGSGPYKYERSDPSRVELVANPYYHHKDKPLIQNISMVVNQADNLHAAHLIGGAIELDPAVRPIDMSTLDAASDVKTVPYASQSWSGFALRNSNKFLNFTSVRQALSYAFNRDEALKAHHVGQGVLITGPFPHSSPYYNFDSDVTTFKYSAKSANVLHQDAGFFDGDGDGVLDYEGEPFLLNMVLNRSMPSSDKQVCQDFVRQLKQVGVDIEIRWLESNLYNDAIYHDHDYDITYVTWRFDEATDIYPLFAKDHQAPGRFNFLEFYNEIIEGYLLQFRTTEDEQTKQAVGKELHRLLAKEAPYIFLWTLNANFAHTTRLRSKSGLLEVHPLHFFTYITDWYLEN